MRQLIVSASEREGVDAIGSTPYVEKSRENETANIDWIIALAEEKSMHLDFHLDYNLDATVEPTVFHVIGKAKQIGWKISLYITLGHCTRLTLLTSNEWQKLRASIGDLPIFFVRLVVIL